MSDANDDGALLLSKATQARVLLMRSLTRGLQLRSHSAPHVSFLFHYNLPFHSNL